jgi:DNA-binding NtrC family response regulator
MKTFHPRKPDQARRPRVLVIEDDAALETLLSRAFQDVDRNIEIRWAHTAEEALLEIHREAVDSSRPYAMILSDMYLPGNTTGLDLYQTCLAKIPMVPFVLTSTMTVSEYYDLAMHFSQAPPYLTKPFVPEKWQAIMKRYLGVA